MGDDPLLVEEEDHSLSSPDSIQMYSSVTYDMKPYRVAMQVPIMFPTTIPPPGSSCFMVPLIIPNLPGVPVSPVLPSQAAVQVFGTAQTQSTDLHGHLARQNALLSAHMSDAEPNEDRPIGSGNGVYKGRRLFHAKPDHASLVPIDGLLRAEDFEGGSSGSSAGGSRNGSQRGQQNRVQGRRKMRQQQEQQQQQERDRRKRQQTPHDLDVDKENFVQNWANQQATQPRGYSDAEEGEDFGDRVTVRLMQPKSLADRALVTRNNRGGSERRMATPASDSESPLNIPVFPPTLPGRVASSSPPPPPPSQPRAQEISPKFDRLDPGSDRNDLDKGSMVEVRLRGEALYGVVRWMGYLPEHDRSGVGIELEDDLPGATNGWHRGSQFFACPESRAVFVPFSHVKRDGRFDRAAGDANKTDKEKSPEALDFGGIDCPAVTGFQAPIKVSSLENLRAKVVGRNKGIQGHQNSCYLDATLFAMFSFTSVFDSLLYRPPTPDDIVEYSDVQRVLRDEVVNPLRKHLFVRADKVMKLRQLLDGLTSVRGLTTEEKDPEEFLNSLLTQTLRAAPFLQLTTNQSAHLYQLFVEKQDGVDMATVQELFEQSFRTSAVKLKQVPPVMILQMPRFGRQYKVYDRIVPSQILDVTDVIQDSPRQCIICGKLATLECLECFGSHGAASGLDSTAFCGECAGPVHSHQRRRGHRLEDIRVPHEFLSCRASEQSAIPRLFMELFAVVCIETSHYVAFVRGGLGPDAPWCFFDSMADRKGEADGYNIPEVKEASDVLQWLSEEGARAIGKTEALPAHVKRLICDGYMCFYQSPQAMMYQ